MREIVPLFDAAWTRHCPALSACRSPLACPFPLDEEDAGKHKAYPHDARKRQAFVKEDDTGQNSYDGNHKYKCSRPGCLHALPEQGYVCNTILAA